MWTSSAVVGSRESFAMSCNRFPCLGIFEVGGFSVRRAVLRYTKVMETQNRSVH